MPDAASWWPRTTTRTPLARKDGILRARMCGGEVAVRAVRGAHGQVAVRRLAAVLVLALSLPGCGITHLSDLAFRVDHRLHFVSPKDRSKQRLPLTISWTMKDFRPAAAGSEPPSKDAGYFAIFVDQQPIRPGQTMKAEAKDHSCKITPGCPTVSDLADRQIYLTTQTSMRFDTISNINQRDKVQLHTFIVVLMNTAGHRIGEAAWELDLRIPKAGS
jgi:hypothetical protein